MALTLPNVGRHLGPRTRKVGRYLAFIVVGLVTFVFAFQMTFPFDRVKDRVVETLSDKYDVTIGDIERGIIPGRMYFKAFSVRTRPTKVGDVATTFYIEQLEVDLGLLALIGGTVSVKLDATIGDAKVGRGHIKGRIALNKDGTSIHMVGDDLPSTSLPVRELGLPMSGKVRFAFNLELPNDKAKTGKVSPNWAKADGGVELVCPSGCTIGDGKSKLKLTTNNVRQQEFLDQGGGGIDFGKVTIDSLFVAVEIKNGKLEITKFDTKSPDGELHAAFSMALNQDFQSSLVTGCLRFRGSDALLKREPKTHAAISTTGAPLGPDNLFHIKLDGQLRQMRRLGVVCGPSANTSMDNPGATPPRPNLTITPESPAKPPGPGAMPPPQPMPSVTPLPMPPPQTGAPPAGSVTDSPHGQPPAPVGEGPPPVVFPSTGSGVGPSTMPQPAPGSGFAPIPPGSTPPQ
jgi:type II secretion system protein N